MVSDQRTRPVGILTLCGMALRSFAGIVKEIFCIESNILSPITDAIVVLLDKLEQRYSAKFPTDTDQLNEKIARFLVRNFSLLR